MTIEEKLNLFLEKNCPTDKAKWAASKAAAKSKFDVYPSAYANGWAAKNYKSKGGGWRKCNESVVNEGGCWEGYKQVGMKDKGGKMVPNCVPINEDNHELNCDENGNCWEMEPPRYQSTSMGYREMNESDCGCSEQQIKEGNCDCDESVEEYDVETLEEFKNFAKYIREYTQLLSEATCPCLLEAEYRGRKVKLGKIMQGDVKKFKVYVKNPEGNVVKVNFGFGGSSAKGKRMVIKKNNPERRKNFRARHNCDSPGPRWKARYWACRTW
jgi:hypothetical protein